MGSHFEAGRIYRALSYPQHDLELPTLDHPNRWHYVSHILEKLLTTVGYVVHQQYQHMLWICNTNAGSLPVSTFRALWRIGSLESSQNFAASECTVRFQFDPTSYNASTGSDPYNRFAMDQVLNRLKRIGIPLDL